MPPVLSRLLAAALLPFVLAIGAAQPVAAQDGQIWANGSFTDEADRGMTKSFLRFALPESDLVTFSALCAANSGVGTATIQVAVDFGNLRRGDPARLSIFGDGFSNSYDGFVDIPDSEEGLYGVSFSVTNDDPLWEALARLSTIRIGVAGLPATILSLRGSAGPVRAFNRDCRFYEGAGAQQTASVPASDPRWESCDRLAGARPVSSEVPVTVTFRNRSGGWRALMIIGPDGVPRERGGLNPGEERTVNTFMTHPWMFTDGPGNCMEMFMPQPGIPVFEITAPNRFFGDE